jgi:hypothetical protein
MGKRTAAAPAAAPSAATTARKRPVSARSKGTAYLAISAFLAAGVAMLMGAYRQAYRVCSASAGEDTSGGLETRATRGQVSTEIDGVRNVTCASDTFSSAAHSAVRGAHACGGLGFELRLSGSGRDAPPLGARASSWTTSSPERRAGRS